MAALAATRDTRAVLQVRYHVPRDIQWETQYGNTPVQAVRLIAERLGLAPGRLGFKLAQLCEVDVFDAGDRTATPLATVTLGLSLEVAQAAREAAVRGALK